MQAMSLLPIWVILGTLGVAFLLDISGRPRQALQVAALGTLLGLVSLIWTPDGAFLGLSVDAFVRFAQAVLLGAAVLALLASPAYLRYARMERVGGDYTLLFLFTLIGGMLLVSVRDWLALFVAFELLSIPLYAAAALNKRSRLGAEGALKFFLFGSVSSAFLLLGVGMMTLVSGDSAFSSVVVREAFLPAGLALLLVGFGFKVAMFPFYFWAPDVYESAPTPLVAFLSVAPKAAGILILFRIMQDVVIPTGLGSALAWVALASALTMIVGNLLALPQTNLKRLLAYSGVAHIGYVLAALASGSVEGAGMSLFYFTVYLFSNMGAFLGVAAVEMMGLPPTLEGVAGLFRRNMTLAMAFLAFLLSLGGIPFVLGFWSKLFVFFAAARAGLWFLVFLGALLAVVALYYYLNVARWMLIVEEGPSPTSPAPGEVVALVVLAALVVVVGGLAPQVLAHPALIAAGG